MDPKFAQGTPNDVEIWQIIAAIHRCRLQNGLASSTMVLAVHTGENHGCKERESMPEKPHRTSLQGL